MAARTRRATPRRPRSTTVGRMTLPRLFTVFIVAVLLLLAASILASVWGMNL